MSVSRLNLYKHALKRGRLDSDIITGKFGDSDVLTLVESNPKRTLKMISGLFTHTDIELE